MAEDFSTAAEVTDVSDIQFEDLSISTSSSSGMLTANCYEFGFYQWKQISSDKSNKEISLSISQQGKERHDAACVKSDVLVTDMRYKYDKEALYKVQREEIIRRLELSTPRLENKEICLTYVGDGKRCTAFSQIFPPYKSHDPVPITVRVSCQIKSAAPVSKKISIVREEGVQNAIQCAKKAHKGISMDDQYEIYLVNKDKTEVLVTDEVLSTLTETSELRIQIVPSSAPVATKAKGKGSVKKPASVVVAQTQQSQRTQQLKDDNSENLIKLDAAAMVLPMSLTINFKEKFSMLSYMVFWAAVTLNHLNGIYIDPRTRAPYSFLSSKAVDCLVSLQRAINEFSSIAPEGLIFDAQFLNKKLVNRLNELHINILECIVVENPSLIDKSTFDSLSPKLNRLYDEQGQVLDILYDSIKNNTPALVGYRVPPSGGKTILSVAIASMIHKHFQDQNKRLLYICYNTLVRLSVANACEQIQLPFWVASTRRSDFQSNGRTYGKSQVVTSYTCRDRSRHTADKIKRVGNKFGDLLYMWKIAQRDTVHFCPIVIADITSAFELLRAYGDDFIVYLDEPTAGAENGIVDNDMQAFMAKIINLLPKQSVLLSATLPNLLTQFPSLAVRFPDDRIKMVETQRLPVGCVAIAPNGSHVLPHQIADTFEEFVESINGLQNDALMLRFYTPSPVHQMAMLIEKIVKDSLPENLRFFVEFNTIGELSHRRIREYAQRLLKWVITDCDVSKAVEIFQKLKTMRVSYDNVPVLSSNFVESHVASEGQALAVTTSQAVEYVENGESKKAESLLELMEKGLESYRGRIPNAFAFLKEFSKQKAEAELKRNGFIKAGDMDSADAVVIPVFQWPVKVAGFSAILTDDEIVALNETVVSQLLSGLGCYDPSSMTAFEQSIIMREATHGHLACLFSSPDIVYGTNMALSTVFIGTGYGCHATRNSLYQLIGRAGRTGRTHKARILFQDFDTMKKALLPEPHGQNFEARVMDWHLQQLLPTTPK